MAMQSYVARVRLDGQIIRVQVDAETLLQARRIIEHQYGNGSIQGIDALR